MKPDDEDEEGLWILGVTRRRAEPEHLFEGSWREAQNHCKESDRPLWVMGNVDRVEE